MEFNGHEILRHPDGQQIHVGPTTCSFLLFRLDSPFVDRDLVLNVAPLRSQCGSNCSERLMISWPLELTSWNP